MATAFDVDQPTTDDQRDSSAPAQPAPPSPGPSLPNPAQPDTTAAAPSSPPPAISPSPAQEHAHPDPAPHPHPLRLRKGTKLEDAYPTPFAEPIDGPDPSAFLHSIESPFQVQEYIALLVRANPHNVDHIVTLPSPSSSPAPNNPSSPATHQRQLSADANRNPLVPQEVWIYEQLRRFSQDLSHPFVTALQAECARPTCPEMKAGEWLYLCAAHATANENDCCAIDYIVHTLDGATALLNSARYFPSRLQIPTTSIKHFTSIARRLYRIFAHAWFHHRDVFEQCETETSLYARFLALTDRFGLISEDLLVIPRTSEEEEHEDDRPVQFSSESQSSAEDDELEELE